MYSVARSFVLSENSMAILSYEEYPIKPSSVMWKYILDFVPHN